MALPKCGEARKVQLTIEAIRDVSIVNKLATNDLYRGHMHLVHFAPFVEISMHEPIDWLKFLFFSTKQTEPNNRTMASRNQSTAFLLNTNY